MNDGIERTLHAMQMAHVGEHLPLEFILDALHDAEYAPPPFFRSVDVPLIKRVPPFTKRRIGTHPGGDVRASGCCEH